MEKTFLLSISQIFAGPDAVDATDKKSFGTKPLQIFKIPEQCPIYSLAFYKSFVIVGTMGKLTGYVWAKNEISKKAWTVKLTSSQEHIEPGEVNAVWLDRLNELLYAGCGDNIIYGVSLEDGAIAREFHGHKDYIHCLSGSENRLFSASEDGSVKFWDTREKRSTNQIEPFKNENLVRPKFGKWQGTVSVTDDWLVCGGGPKPSLWHLRSLDSTTDYAFPGGAHVSAFVDDAVLIAGDCNCMYQFTLSGDITAEVPISAPSVYSVVWQLTPQKCMSIGGSSNKLDICTDFNYKDIVLDLYSSFNNNKLT